MRRWCAFAFPCFSRSISHKGPYKDGPGSINQPVTVGGMLVHPGDVVVGDTDGVIAVRPDEALAVAKLAHEKVAHERQTIADILAGKYSSDWVKTTLAQKGA